MCLWLHVGVGSGTGTLPTGCLATVWARIRMVKVHSYFTCRGWLVPVLMTRTEDIYLAAGLDAVVMLKTIEYGVQIFTPMAMLSLALRMSPSKPAWIHAAHLQICGHSLVSWQQHDKDLQPSDLHA